MIDWTVIVLLAAVVAIALVAYAQTHSGLDRRVRIAIFAFAIAIGALGLADSIARKQLATSLTSALLVALGCYYLYQAVRPGLPSIGLAWLQGQTPQAVMVRVIIALAVGIAAAVYLYLSEGIGLTLLFVVLVGGGFAYLMRGRLRQS